MLTKQLVEQMIEEDLRKKILVPLLRAMGFQDVYEYHGGAGERGKDIVCWRTNDLGNRENLAIVAKSKAMTGKAIVGKGTAGEIQTQVQQCFGSPFTDPITGQDEHVNRCWVMSNKVISKESIIAIKDALGKALFKENVEFVGIDKLWELIEKFLPPQAVLQKLEEARTVLENWDTHYRLQASITEAGIQFTPAEKFPGASLEKPIDIKTAFSFPTDTEEGRFYAEAMGKYFADGTPAKIPLKYLRNIELPDFMQQMLPQMTEDGFFLLGRAYNPKSLLARIDIVCDDGDAFSLDYVELRVFQAGREAITFNNDEQQIATKVKVIIRFNGKLSNIGIEFQNDPSMNVHMHLTKMEAMNCLSKPHSIRFTILETGICSAIGKQEAICEAPDTHFMEVIRALDALQLKTGTPVYLPERDLIEEEIQIIEQLRVIFLTGHINASWNTITTITSVASSESNKVAELLQWLDGEKVMMFPLHFEEAINLFGLTYPLGKIKSVSVEGKLSNEQEVREKLAHLTDSEGKIELTFVPTDDGTFIKEYLDWMH